MLKVYLYHQYDNTYLYINVTNQTATGWHSNLNKVEQLADTTERSLLQYYNTYTGKSLDDIAEYFSVRPSFTVIELIDSINPYEFW